MIEEMTWYSVQFLGDLGSFLVTEEVMPFIALGIMFFIVGIIRRIMY